MQIYGLKNCDTCRKAAKARPDAQLIDVRETALPQPVLAAAYAQFGAALLNTRSTTWRNLSESDRQGDVPDLIRRHPPLMKRPLIDDGGSLHLGWGQDVRDALL